MFYGDGIRSSDGDGVTPDGAVEPGEEWWRRMSPPENEIPVAVAAGAVIGRGPDAAVAITGVQAYSTGIQVSLALRLRTASGADGPDPVMELFMGHTSWGPDPADLFLLGFEYADGRVASTLGGNDHSPGPARPAAVGEGAGDEQPVVSNNGGGGGSRTYDSSLWLTPLPPPGPLRVVCAWERLGIPETVTVLDGAAIADAAARAETLWPWEPDRERESPATGDRPPLPGWFARFDR